MHKPKLKVTFFSFGILEQGGGFEYFLMDTARDLDVKFEDLEVSVVTMDPKTVEKLQHILTIYFMRQQKPDAIYRETYEAVLARLGKVNYQRATSLRELKALLQEADVIYSKNEVLELAVLNKIGMKHLPPVVLGVHTPIKYHHAPSLSARLHNILYTGWLYKTFIRRVNRIQVNNSDDLQFVKDRLNFSQVRMIRQAFDFPALAARKIDHTEPLKLLFVGRLTEAKGIDLLLEIVKALDNSKVKDYRLKIAGSGDKAIVDSVRELAQSNASVEYLGHVPNEEVSRLYEWAEVVVIPSRYDTLNKVAIETAMAGKIAVATNVSGPREVIKHTETGYLVEPVAANFVIILEKLAALERDDPADFLAIGARAHDYVKHKYNPDEVYNELYKDLVAATQGI